MSRFLFAFVFCTFSFLIPSIRAKYYFYFSTELVGHLKRKIIFTKADRLHRLYNMTSIEVLYFAIVRDGTKKEKETILVESDNPTVESVISELKKRYSSLSPLFDSSLVSLNEEYCDKEEQSSTQIKDNDVIGIIPPVSGG
ncbi:hypothetical protein BX070DRAFT_24863 [Coemansia spiralis]|nr:hypothetical protein BX070DRAFT_24863 [Coemansia spiralis]